MATQRTESERVRAWVFVRAEEAPSAMQGLYRKLGHKGDDRYVLIRADIVDYRPYNVVVPVDAESEEALQEVSEMIKDHPGVSETLIVRVEKHIPYPPHNAHGYITGQEADLSRDEKVKHGRQGASPGYNGWG
jgi:hypothetical protein